MAAESKLSEFVLRGYRLGGVVHVGANDGEEYEWYHDHGMWPVLLIDPLQEAKQRFHERYGSPDGVRFAVTALAGYSGSISMTIPEDGDDEKTSALEAIPTPGHPWTEIGRGKTIGVPVDRFDAWSTRNAVDVTAYSVLVVDVQGMEQEVLDGFGDLLPSFDFLSIELSETPMYRGEPPACDMIEWLATKGYRQFSDVVPHGDVLFLKEWLV